MKKLRNSIISTVVSSLLIASIQSVSVSATDSPCAYAKCVYVDGNRVRVDVYLENVSSFSSVGFRVDLGDGFDVAYKPYNPSIVWKEGTGTYDEYAYGITLQNNNNSNGVVVLCALTESCPMLYDIPFVSFYVYKNSSATNYNTTASVVFPENIGEINDEFSSPTLHYDSSHIQQIPMTKLVEYVLGDVDGNDTVNNSDAIALSYALNQDPYQYNVYSIENSYTQYFPNAKDSYALDPNENGIVSDSDSVAILQYVGLGNNYSGNIGRHFYHSYY